MWGVVGIVALLGEAVAEGASRGLGGCDGVVGGGRWGGAGVKLPRFRWPWLFLNVFLWLRFLLPLSSGREVGVGEVFGVGSALSHSE